MLGIVAVYNKQFDRGVRFDAPSIGIHWGITDPILSQKDKQAPTLEESDCNFIYGGKDQ